MANETQEKTSHQTATTAHPFASNTQDFADSDDDILDNFAEGAKPDDGVPLGLGGEKGKQAEPASTTLEADIVNGTLPKQQLPDETIPSETPAATPVPDQGPASEKGKAENIPAAPDGETDPEFPPMLLRMAGYADVEAAKADGFSSPETLNAFIRGLGQRLASPPAEGKSQPGQPYGRARKEPPAAPPPAAPPAKAEPDDQFKPFELSKEDVDILDEHLIDTIKRMDEHHRRQFDALRSSLSQREAKTADEQAEEEAFQFDKAVQALGADWQDVFGEGDVGELVRKGQSDPTARMALEYRRELFDAVQAVRAVNSQRGLEPMDLQREIGFGLLHKFPDRFQKTFSSNSSAPSGRQRTYLNRPSQRKGAQAQQDPLLAKLSKKYPGAGFNSKDPDDFEGDI